jgi:hypothetical protein
MGQPDEFAELGWRGLDALPYEITEAAGELLVWWKDILRDRWPWHTHAHPDAQGNLHVLDLVRGRWVKEYPAGSWTAVNRGGRP